MKKHALLILVSIPITILNAAAEKQAFSYNYAGFLARQLALTAALQSTLSQGPIHIITEYDHYEPKWQEQIIKTDEETQNLAISPNEGYILAFQASRHLGIFCPNTGNLMHQLTIDPYFSSGVNPYYSFDISKNKLFTIDLFSKKVKAWDILTKNLIRTTLEETENVSSIKCLTENRLIVARKKDEIIQLWDTAIGKCLKSMPLPLYGFFATTNDEKLLATASHKHPNAMTKKRSVKIWNAHTFEHIRTIKDHGASAIAFSPDGKQLAIAPLTRDTNIFDKEKNYYTIRIKNPNTGKTIRKLKQYTHMIDSMLFSLSGLLATKTEDGKFFIFDSQNDQPCYQLACCNGPITSVAFSPMGTHIALGFNNGIEIVKMVSGNAKKEKNSCCIS